MRIYVLFLLNIVHEHYRRREAFQRPHGALREGVRDDDAVGIGCEFAIQLGFRLGQADVPLPASPQEVEETLQPGASDAAGQEEFDDYAPGRIVRCFLPRIHVRKSIRNLISCKVR